MSTTARSLVKSVMEALNDEAGVRWSAKELVGYLNDGQREIATLRPDSTTISDVHVLTPGVRQTLPANAIKLIKITGNTQGRMRATKLTSREVIEAWNANWQSMSPSTEIVHYFYDIREPRAYYVYPPAALGAALHAVYSTTPVDVAEPQGISYDTVVGDVSTHDSLVNALRQYILYRCYAKNVEFAGSGQIASLYYNAFTTTLGMDAGVGANVRPVAPEPTTRTGA